MLRVVCSRVYPYPVNRSPCQASCPLHMSAGSRGGSRRENLFNFTPRPPSSSRNVCETQGVFPTSYRNCLPEQKILSFSKAFILRIRDYFFFFNKNIFSHTSIKLYIFFGNRTTAIQIKQIVHFV